MFKITAPAEGYTGKRGNVAFIDGVAETDDPHMVAYFKRHGYDVEDSEKQPAKPPAKKPAPKPSE